MHPRVERLVAGEAWVVSPTGGNHPLNDGHRPADHDPSGSAGIVPQEGCWLALAGGVPSGVDPGGDRVLGAVARLASVPARAT